MRIVNLLPQKVREYLSEDFESVDLVKYDCFYHFHNLHDRPIPVKINLPRAIMNRPVTVTVSGGKDVRTATIGGGEFSCYVTNLSVDTVYTVEFKAGEQTAREQFKTAATLPRFLEVGGVRNVRDFGGWKAEGGRLKFDRIIRGSELNLIENHMVEITEEGKKTLLEDFKVRTDIDLRNEEETGYITQSPLGAGVSYHRCTVLGYMNIFKSEFTAAVKQIFTIFADENSYPIYLHCWAGADRTGTVVALLKLALGVSYEDITRDYEVSAFSMFGLRGRCNKEFTYVEIFRHLRDTYPAENLQKSTQRYLMEEIGITKEQLIKISENLIEKTVG